VTAAFGYLFNELCSAGCPFTAGSRWEEMQGALTERFMRFMNPFRILVGDVPEASLLIGVGADGQGGTGAELGSGFLWDQGMSASLYPREREWASAGA
jgi:hypothetical protein